MTSTPSTHANGLAAARLSTRARERVARADVFRHGLAGADSRHYLLARPLRRNRLLNPPDRGGYGRDPDDPRAERLRILERAVLRIAPDGDGDAQVPCSGVGQAEHAERVALRPVS